MGKFANLVLAGSVVVCSQVHAKTRPGFAVTAEVSNLSSREFLDDGASVRSDGFLAGAAISYVETLGGGLFITGRLSVSAGAVDYRSSDATRLNDVAQSVGQLEVLLGYDLAVGEGTTLTPFIGLGSRYLDDRSGNKRGSDGLAGYNREISYGYTPIGIATTIPIAERANVEFAIQYNHVVKGTSKAYFSNVAPLLPDVKFEVGRGHGIEASASLTTPLGRRQLSAGPFLRTWRVNRSKTYTIVGSADSADRFEVFEPRTRTVEAGLRIGIGF